MATYNNIKKIKIGDNIFNLYDSGNSGGTITSVKTTAGTHSAINVASGAANFNVPTKTSHLTNDSGFLTSHQTLYEANLNWGGKDFSASYGPIDAAMIDVLGANRFAFLKAAGLTIEYSTNGGSSYTDYGATDAQKVGLFSNGQSFYLGKHSTAGSCTTNDRLRVTINTGTAGIYTALNKIAIYMSTQGSTVQVLIEKALESTPTTFVTHKDWTGISGWSGWNILNISSITTYGNTAASQYGRIRFTFRATAVNTTYSAALITKIQGYGGQGWTVPSNMAASGHLYSYDSAQNATFPAKVTATGGFSGNLTGNVTGNVSGTSANVTGTVAIANGGTGQTTAANAINALLNGLPTWTADPTDTTYFVRQDTGGAAVYGKVQATTLWNYISGKLPAWSKASTKPTYTASEVGALASNTTYVSTVTTTAGAHTAISSKSGAVSFNVPTKTSHLTNDSGFITASHTSTYSLPLAASGTRGGVQIGYSESGTNYAVKLSSEKMYVSVPWTDTKVTVGALQSGVTYYPMLATGDGTATRQIDSTLTGLKYVSTAGTTSTVGTARLVLGNSIAPNTANNEQGVLRLYSGAKNNGSNSSPYIDVLNNATVTRTITLPDATGTVALTSDIPTVPTNISAFTNDSGYLTSSSTLDATKLSGTIPADCYTNTTYGIATNTTSGLVKPWYTHTAASTGPTTGNNTTAVAVNTITTTASRYYAIEADSNGRLFVNVPWSDSNTNYYHTTGSWNGLTYTATANGGAGALAFTIPTGTSATTVAVGNHTHSYAASSSAGGSATTAATTADTTNALYPVGVTSSATTTLKRDTSITFTGGTISCSGLTVASVSHTITSSEYTTIANALDALV